MSNLDLIIAQFSNKNVFEKFAGFFEKVKLSNNSPNISDNVQHQIEILERRLQDLSDYHFRGHRRSQIKAAITKTNNRLLFYYFLIERESENDNSKAMTSIISILYSELRQLNSFLVFANIKELSSIDLTGYFEKLLNKDQIKTLEKYIGRIEDFSYQHSSKKYINPTFDEVISQLKANKELGDLTNQTEKSNPQEKYESEGESTIYHGTISITINSKDPFEANKFMAVIASIFENIEDVSLKIEDTGMGSIWQKWRITIKGWFAKEETKQILTKGLKAAEMYALDRQIEPIEKTKAERIKISEETKRLMSNEQTKELHRIQIEKEKEELKKAKLENYGLQLEIAERLSNMIKNEIITVDSDFRIEINNLLLAEKKNGQLNFGDVEIISSSFSTKQIEKRKNKKIESDKTKGKRSETNEIETED